MKPQRLLPLLLALLLTGLLACDRDDDPQPCPPPSPFRRIDPELVRYLFDTGSYWVYQDEWNGTMDTVRQTSMYRTTYRYYGQGGTGTMTGGCSSVSSGEQFNFQQEGQLYYERVSVFVMGNAVTRGGYYGNYMYFAYPEVGQSRGGATVEAIHDSISIGGTMFHDVTQLRLASANLDWWPTRVFFSPSIGIVRREWNGLDSAFGPGNLVAWHVTPFPYL